MKFSSEQVACTCSIHDKISSDAEFSEFVQQSLSRHFSCDWGDTPPEDCLANAMALATDDRILSAYIHKKSDRKIWILTECDRSITTVLYPEEY